MRRLVVVAVVLLLAGCGSSAGSEDTSEPSVSVTDPALVPCEEVYADGITTTETMVDQECERTQGEAIKDTFVPGMMVTECDDGRVLLWNDYGWGFVDEPWHAHPADADELVAPLAERTACEP